MQRRFVLAATLTLCAVGCRRELPPPAAVPMPVPDGRPALLAGRPLSKRLASYQLRATLDAAAGKVTGHETLTWRHDGLLPVEEIPLHLYMNAFSSEDTPFMRHAGGRHGDVPAAAEGFGWIEIATIKTGDGRDLRPGAKFPTPDDKTLLSVPLGRSVAPGEELVLDVEFTVKLPDAIARTGRKGAFAMVAQWFPKIGVLVATPGSDGAPPEQHWAARTFHANSEFFADFGTYDVELTVPDTHVIAATGVLVGARDAGKGMRTLTYRAEDVHDFAWMADPYMKVLRGTAHTPGGDVEVRVYHRPGYEAFAPRHVAAAIRTIETWSKLLVPYPWPVMSIIDPPWEAMAAVGGMEYPTIVTAGAAVDFPGLRFPEEVTVHEVTHNWFQGMLASNEVEEPFLDEGMTEFMTGVIMDDMFGPDLSAADTFIIRMGYYPLQRVRLDSSAMVSTANTPSYAAAPGEYGAVGYNKPCQTLKTLEGMVGRDRLLGAIGLYARRNAFGHPREADLIAALNEGLGEDFSWFLRPAFDLPGSVDFGVGNIRERKGHTEVTIERRGNIPVPVEVTVTFADGTEAHERWGGRESYTTFAYDRGGDIVAVAIDPRGLVTLEHNRIDDAESERHHGPSLRAGARTEFWLQTAAGLVGL